MANIKYQSDLDANRSKSEASSCISTIFEISAFLITSCMIASPFQWRHFYLLLNEMKVSLNWNGLLYKKITFKILINLMNTIDFNEQDVNIFVAKICGQHRATIQNYNVTWTSLWTNLKAKSTLTRWLLRPNRPVAGALHDNNLQLHLAFDTAGEWNQSLFSNKAICSSFFSPCPGGKRCRPAHSNVFTWITQ